ncbi:hypothetical protein [Chenggangzhangella methanolivorans]|uniref:Uncharacterized protein n=1 Tax=Chenggangzhangella methanolivorans TaxID=1437009 RepID=A0A9E6R8G5_9HYPH|nr:hypothetical protein [Chenggangzhangella methanolivorans]QZO00131.1 hypothetical protein K6K41_26875 [Chenggangzhangella methanolivorans]
MPDIDRPEAPGEERSASKAAFLGSLLAFLSLVALSVIGVGHARTIEGAANAQYWIVVAGIAAALAFVTTALARTRARGRTGETLRRVAVPLATLWLVIFLWETAAVGAGAFPGPFELGWAAWKG